MLEFTAWYMYLLVASTIYLGTVQYDFITRILAALLWPLLMPIYFVKLMQQ